MARIFEFEGERYWQGNMYCPKGDHVYPVTLFLDIAQKYIGRHANCDLHKGKWYEKTAAEFDMVVHLEMLPSGRFLNIFQYDGKNPRKRGS